MDRPAGGKASPSGREGSPFADGAGATERRTKLLVATVGLAGSGKSTAVDMLQKLTGAPRVYFGGIVVGEVRRRGLTVNETNERIVREDLRHSHGMGVIAELVAEEIDASLGQSDIVLLDGLYSYPEYEILTGRGFGAVVLVAVHSERSIRERRLVSRATRPLRPDEIRARDLTEVRTLDKATPIALADFHIVNDGTIEQLADLLARVLRKIGWRET